ncbi:MAG: hypothetical protein U0821_18570 [Chloroflexota bacterium]
MAEKLSTVERRANLLADRLQKRSERLVRRMTGTKPPFQVAMDEESQVRVYVRRLLAGELPMLRQSNGGPFDDAEVDRYVAKMERLLAKLAPGQLLQQYRDLLEREHGAFLSPRAGLEGDDGGRE